MGHHKVLEMDQIELLRESAKAHKNALQLRKLAAELIDSGTSREQILSDLELLTREFRSAANNEAEDAVTDVMDFVVGWCAPNMRL